MRVAEVDHAGCGLGLRSSTLFRGAPVHTELGAVSWALIEGWRNNRARRPAESSRRGARRTQGHHRGCRWRSTWHADNWGHMADTEEVVSKGAVVISEEVAGGGGQSS